MNALTSSSRARSEQWTTTDREVITIGPIRAAYLILEREFVDGLSAHTAYQRLMSGRRLFVEEIRRFTDVDGERELALIPPYRSTGMRSRSA